MPYERFWTSPPELLVAGGSQTFTFAIAARRVRVRSDFPVAVTLDGSTEAVGVGTARGPLDLLFEEPQGIDTVRLSLPTGFTAQADLVGRHGVGLVEGQSGQGEFAGLDRPELLPHHTYLFAGAIALSADPPATITTVGANWNIGTKRPEVVWVTGVSMSREVAAAPFGRPAATTCFEVQLQKAQGPAGDQLTILIAKGAGQAWQGIFNVPVKLPLRSIFTPWAAEVPEILIRGWHEVDGAAATGFAVGLNVAYMMR